MWIKWVDVIHSKEIYLHPMTLHELGLKKNQLICINYGAYKNYKRVRVQTGVNKGCIVLSSIHSNQFVFPKDIKYRIHYTNGEFYVGPVIGLIVGRSQTSLTPKKLEVLKERLNQITVGLIFVSCQDFIDYKNRCMKGFYFNKDGEWKEGIFPFPSVLYSRSYINKVDCKRLSEDSDVKIIHNCRMTKTKLWKLLSDDPNVNQHLPYTKKLLCTSDFIDMSRKFQVLYLKPTNLSRGRGIIQVTKTPKGFVFRDYKNNEHVVTNQIELDMVLETLTNKHPYLIQQGVPFHNKDRLLDFRVYMQKDQTLDWQCSGIYGRLSKPKRVVTNLKHSQQVFSFDEAIERFYHLKGEKVQQVEVEIINVCKKICIALEKQNQIIGDVAIDIVVSPNHHIWVLEVQVSYAADERLYHLPKNMALKVWKTPIQYAIAVTGFLNHIKTKTE